MPMPVHSGISPDADCADAADSRFRMTGGGTGERLDRRTRIALAAMSLAAFVIANDITSLSVALPSIEHAFGVDVSTCSG